MQNASAAFKATREPRSVDDLEIVHTIGDTLLKQPDHIGQPGDIGKQVCEKQARSVVAQLAVEEHQLAWLGDRPEAGDNLAHGHEQDSKEHGDQSRRG